MLKEEWKLEGEGHKRVFCGSMKLMNFKRLVKEYPRHKIDAHLKACFLSLLQDDKDVSDSNSCIALRRKVQELSSAFSEMSLSASRKRVAIQAIS